MKRQIARSPFQLEELEVGEPRPVYRRLVFASPYSLRDTDQHLLPAPAIQRGSVQIAQRNCNASQCIDASLFPAAVGRSLRSDNNAAKVLLLDKWVAVAESLRDCSSVLQPFPHLSGPDFISCLRIERCQLCQSKGVAGCDGVNLLKPYRSCQGSQRQRQCSTLLKLCQWGRGWTVVAKEQPGHKGSCKR